jgi:tetratricopeptide (TPR) repeat protein
MANMSVLNRQAGYAFGDQILQATAQAIFEAAGPHCQVSRIQGDSFAVLLPGIGPQRLPARAGQIAQAVCDLVFDHPVSHIQIRPEISMGGACFPQDMKGSYLQATAQDQARHLFDLAREGQKRALNLGRQDVITPEQILKNCGQVLEIISSSRVRIDLGADHQARKGLHFQIQSQIADNDHSLGTELCLIQVKSTSSLAETILAPAGEKTIQPGARLKLIENPNKYTLQSSLEKDSSENHGRLQIISSPKDFFPRWAVARSQVSRFTVSLISAPPSSLWDVIYILQIKEQELPASSLLARYGLGGLLLYLPDHSPQETMHILQALAADLPVAVQPETAAGIGYSPCLDHTPGETLDMAKQALEHARLLPAPGLACFDSTTLTLQGDRAFARNELRQAMHAYNQALLLDVANILARNSLAICLARVGECSAACTEFRRILDLEPENYMAEYNYGYVCLKLQEREQARACFQRCLGHMPGHSYSLLRLGQMAEEDGDLEQAETFFRQAVQSAPDQGAPHRVLGRLAWKRKDRDAARKHLHQALIVAPQDPEALRLLARLTLEQGDDPEVAESLIRRSLGLQPDHTESMELLNWAVRERDGK